MSVYRRLKLPHLHPPGATFSILFLVNDAVPRPFLRQLSIERSARLNRIRQQKLPGWQRALREAQKFYDYALDRALRLHATQDHPLARPEAAQLMVDQIKKYQGRHYDLCAYSVMSNHVHMELDFSIQLPDKWNGEEKIPDYKNVAKVMNLIKGGSAYQINKLLDRRGQPLWTKRYRDRFIRDERHLKAACIYTKQNPVKAKLVKRWEDHPFTGGMSEQELSDRRHRRVYPDPGYWIGRLGEYDGG
ncbi:MAG: transposase [Bacteroidota bacterium]